MNIKCCNIVRTTKFCPDCGKQLKATDPLASLLEHVKTNARRLSKRADSQFYDRSKSTAAAAMWTEWAEVLGQVVAERKRINDTLDAHRNYLEGDAK